MLTLTITGHQKGDGQLPTGRAKEVHTTPVSLPQLSNHSDRHALAQWLCCSYATVKYTHREHTRMQLWGAINLRF